jgi:hypothetical protein
MNLRWDGRPCDAIISKLVGIVNSRGMLVRTHNLNDTIVLLVVRSSLVTRIQQTTSGHK